MAITGGGTCIEGAVVVEHRAYTCEIEPVDDICMLRSFLRAAGLVFLRARRRQRLVLRNLGSGNAAKIEKGVREEQR
jgi:hypothetical protein